MMHFLRTFSIMRAYSVKLIANQIMEKLYASKTFLKTAGGRMHTPHPPLWIRPRHNYRNYEKILAYFRH